MTTHNNIAGYAFISYEVNYDNYLRIDLNHFSTSFYENYDIILESLIKYLSDNLIFDEIIVNIYYAKKDGDGDFEVNAYIRDIFKKNKFKWLKLENTLDERFVKMSKKLSEKTESTKMYVNFIILNALLIILLDINYALFIIHFFNTF